MWGRLGPIPRSSESEHIFLLRNGSLRVLGHNKCNFRYA